MPIFDDDAANINLGSISLESPLPDYDNSPNYAEMSEIKLKNINKIQIAEEDDHNG